MTTENPKDGYPVKQYRGPVKRYCQMLNIIDDREKIALYRECHSRAKSWPEIREGIRSVGILEMELYILGNTVFMIVETPLDFQWEEAMDRLSKLPRQEEWEDYVSMMQGCPKGATSDQKWQLMERMFYLYD